VLNFGQSSEAEVPALPVRWDWILALICYLGLPVGKEALSWCGAAKAGSLLAVLLFFPALGQNPSPWVCLPCLGGSPWARRCRRCIWKADAEQLLVSSWLSLQKEKS